MTIQSIYGRHCQNLPPKPNMKEIKSQYYISKFYSKNFTHIWTISILYLLTSILYIKGQGLHSSILIFFDSLNISLFCVSHFCLPHLLSSEPFSWISSLPSWGGPRPSACRPWRCCWGAAWSRGSRRCRPRAAPRCRSMGCRGCCTSRPWRRPRTPTCGKIISIKSNYLH